MSSLIKPTPRPLLSRIFRAALPALLAFAPALALAQVSTPAVAIYPAPALPASTQYSCQVLVDGVWQTSYVNFNPQRTFGSGSGDESGKSFSWTTFETNAPIKVRVKRLEGAFNTFVLRPLRYGIVGTKIGTDTVEFTIAPGQKVSVEFDTEIKASAFTGPPYGIPIIKDSMMVFADTRKLVTDLDGVAAADIYTVTPGTYQVDTPVSGAPSATTAGKSTLGTADGKKVVVFGPGVYDIGYWQVPNNVEHIHLMGGAVVFGAIDVIPQNRTPFYDAATINQVYRDAWRQETLRSSFKFTGPGIINGSKLIWHLKKDFSYTSNDDWWAHVKLVQFAVASVYVRDVTICDSPHWVLSWINDDDERTTGTLDNFKMVGAWTYNNDGLPNPAGAASRISNAFIHADDDAFKIYNSGSTIENCVVWQSNNGAVFQFGWFPKTVSNVLVTDIDVIHFYNWYGVQQSNRAVFNFANAGGTGTISNLTFNNINIEEKILRLFGFNTVGSAQIMRDWTFTNLNVPLGMGVGQIGAPGNNYFLGAITNFSFTNFYFNGAYVTNPAQALFEFSANAGSGFTFGGVAIPPPEAPTNLGATPAPGALNLTWTDNAAFESAFELNHSTTGASGPWTTVSYPSNATSATLSNLTPSVPVFLRLRAVNSSGQSDWTPVISATPGTFPVPNAPDLLAVTLPTDTSLRLNWSDNSTNETGFEIQRATSLSGPWTSLPNVAANINLTYATGLTENTTYFFRVRAFTAQTQSDWSPIATGTTLAASIAPPAAPTNLVATANGSNAINLTWTDNATTETAYVVQRTTSPVAPWATVATLPANTTSHTDTGLTAGTKYVYRIRAQNANGLSAASNSASATPVATGLPAGWTKTDIGAVALAGNTTHSAGTFNVTGSGNDIYNTADAFHFVYLPASGDCSISAKVVSMQGTDNWAKAGVMIRASTSPGSPNIFACIAPSGFSPNQGVRRNVRLSEGATTNSSATVVANPPYWLRLTRTGTVIIMEHSPDGVVWTRLGSNTQQFTNIPADCLIGLAVTSRNNSVTNTAVFTNVTVVQ